MRHRGKRLFGHGKAEKSDLRMAAEKFLLSLTMVLDYDFNEPGGYLGNVGLTFSEAPSSAIIGPGSTRHPGSVGQR